MHLNLIEIETKFVSQYDLMCSKAEINSFTRVNYRYMYNLTAYNIVLYRIKCIVILR